MNVMLVPTLVAENDYLKSISRSVGHWELNTAAVVLLIVVACAVLMALGVHLVLKRLHAIRNPHQPIFTLTDPDEVLSILIKALDNRSNFELSLTSGNSKVLVCTLTDVHYACLALELPAYVSPSESWIGREVQVFFAIPADGSQKAHYFFHSEILDLFPGEAENVSVLINYPQSLQQKQKRNHLRLDPPPRFVTSVKVWPASSAPGTGLETNLQRFAEPLLQVPGQVGEEGQIRIMNLSASGLRLKISRGARKKSGIIPDDFRACIIALNLQGVEDETPLQPLLHCRVKNIHEDVVSRDLQLGLQFTARGQQVDQRNPEQVRWERVDPEQGVEEIGTWVIKLHLKLYREKGII
jgi:hypothetical protein